jgi:hypothetical protein
MLSGERGLPRVFPSSERTTSVMTAPTGACIRGLYSYAYFGISKRIKRMDRNWQTISFYLFKMFLKCFWFTSIQSLQKVLQ